MQNLNLTTITIIIIGVIALFYGLYKISRYAFVLNAILIIGCFFGLFIIDRRITVFSKSVLMFGCPLFFMNLLMYVFLHEKGLSPNSKDMYKVHFKIKRGRLNIQNIKRGASIIGSAGSGKTESVVYNFLQHFSKYSFSGVIHDYKDFEITEMAYPLFKAQNIPFYVVSFDTIYHRVNPIAPRYIENEESVNEVSRVLIENLLEQKESGTSSSSKFFTDAAEGLIGGLIWKLKTTYPKYCTLPHLIAIYQHLDTDSLIAFLESNKTAKGMASAFISGKDSDRQTAGVKSTLANALKKISTKRIFMVLSADDVPLAINTEETPGVISVVNYPKFETAYTPLIATIVHTITKQMSIRHRKPSFLLMEEASTIRLLNMHRIPATLRSYNIATVYVMQNKVQNDIMYGDKASKAILSNLSYQFFGKVNDPDTAKYYERFFELIKMETTSINKGHNLNFDTRVTKGEKEVSKVRADTFFKLKPGEFISFTDGEDRKIQFQLQTIQKGLPKVKHRYAKKDIKRNFKRIYREAHSLFGK
ncbi:type IV secretory system conjugative DNA transfer family protein [Seonamhaeicola sp. MEBiC1930]|uniref:type IV secretory system conjugative DNA transfer family protein n=1 Tax=Seonamhaeicola sp. MEBiC01930 TaxID=2976768 RepID=UPI00324A846E